MVTDDKSKLGDTSEKILSGDSQPKIVWDDTNMKSVYANVANVMGTRDEIVLMFGMNQAWHSGQNEMKVQLIDRIILNPFVAKRLSALLNNILRHYESRFGALDTDSI